MKASIRRALHGAQLSFWMGAIVEKKNNLRYIFALHILSFPALMPETPAPTSTCMARPGPQHFAYLRAVAEGVPVAEAARRYLGVEDGRAAGAAHRAVVEWLRAVARRAGERRWRLIGLALPPGEADERPALEDWAAGQGLADWSEAELVELYAQAFPEGSRDTRRQRLRERQLAALRDLEAVAVEQPRAQDPVAAWFEPQAAARLERAGLHTLEALRRRVARGGRWWRGLPGVGAVKAGRIGARLGQLLPLPPPPCFGRTPGVATAEQGAGLGDGPSQEDRALIEAWVAARAGSAATARAYRREALRLALWAAVERRRPLAALGPQDGLAYAAFLEQVPEHWISRRRAKPLQPGWAPFAGPLSAASRRQALSVLAAFHAWAVDEGRLARNPWRELLEGRTGALEAEAVGETGTAEAAASAGLPRSSASGESGPGRAALLARIEAQPPSASRERALLVLRLGEATGLRPGELLAARLGDLAPGGGGWTLRVRRGARWRELPLPEPGRQALVRYLQCRGLAVEDRLPRRAPLLASLADPLRPIGYQALYESLRGWLGRARHGGRPLSAGAAAARASGG